MRERVGLAVLLLLALALRLHGLWWDEGLGFHPDERWLLSVAEGLHWPATVADALAPTSPLNPFWDGEAGAPRRFAYGHFPLTLLRLLEPLLRPLTPTLFSDERLTLLGRLLSVGSDLLTLLLLWGMARGAGQSAALLATGGWAVAWLPVQQAHFATVDSLLTMLATAALAVLGQVLVQPSPRRALLAGGLVGVAVGTKASAFLLLVPLAWALAGGANQERAPLRSWEAALVGVVGAFGLTNPYALLDAPMFFASLWAEQRMVSGAWLYPYTQQFRLALPGLYQVVQQGRWFLGWPLALMLGAGMATGFGGLLRPQRERRDGMAELLMIWLLAYLALSLAAFAQFPRYLLPALPALLLLGAQAVARLPSEGGRRWVVAGVLFPTLLWTVGLGSIYGSRHPWLAASAWLYEQVPAGAVVVQETWDQGLPVAMQINGRDRVPTEYGLLQVEPYAPSSPEQMTTWVEVLTGAEWVVLASPRTWRVLPRLPEFAVAGRAYRALFDGSAGFEVAGVWRVEGQLGPVTFAEDPFAVAGLEGTAAHKAWRVAQPTPLWWNPGPADESLSVYDHPTVLVLRRMRVLSRDEVERLLR